MVPERPPYRGPFGPFSMTFSIIEARKSVFVRAHRGFVRTAPCETIYAESVIVQRVWVWDGSLSHRCDRGGIGVRHRRIESTALRSHTIATSTAGGMPPLLS
jgi:hypothetical protein